MFLGSPHCSLRVTSRANNNRDIILFHTFMQDAIVVDPMVFHCHQTWIYNFFHFPHKNQSSKNLETDHTVNKENLIPT